MKPTILFCSSPLSSSQPNENFADEYDSARQAGFETRLYNDDLLMIGDVAGSLATIPQTVQPTPVIFRGWMLREAAYQSFYTALREKNYILINNPDEYLNGHYLPRAYPYLQAVTPKTVWMPADTPMQEIARILAAEFGDRPLVIKDYVKSQKHYWAEACFISSAARPDQIERITRRFLELQQEELTGGLVYRAYIPFRIIGQHPKSGMPIAK